VANKKINNGIKYPTKTYIIIIMKQIGNKLVLAFIKSLENIFKR